MIRDRDRLDKPKLSWRHHDDEFGEVSELMGNGKRECPNCAVEVPKTSQRCPICSYEFPRHKSGLFKLVAIILIILFLIPLVHLAIRLLK